MYKFRGYLFAPESIIFSRVDNFLVPVRMDSIVTCEYKWTARNTIFVLMFSSVVFLVVISVVCATMEVSAQLGGKSPRINLSAGFSQLGR